MAMHNERRLAHIVPREGAMRGKVPVAFALEGGEHRLRSGLFSFQKRARATLEVRGHNSAVLLGAWQITGRVYYDGERRGNNLSDTGLRCGQRSQARCVDDLVVVGEAPLADRILGGPQRQDAERAGRQPDDPRAGLQSILLQRSIELAHKERPQFWDERV